MKIIKFVLVILSVSLFISGCVDETVDETPTPAPEITETAIPVTPTITPAITATPTPEPTPVRNRVTYKVYIDDVTGFYKVRALDSMLPFNYTNATLEINAGDSIIWVSDSEESYTITVVSEQGLWDNTSAKLMARYRQFNYTFTRPGEYNVYIKENQRKRQKLIVNP